MRACDLLIVEHGVDWTRWIEAQNAHGRGEVVSVIQHREESPERFVERVEVAVRRLVEERVEVGFVALLGADDWEVPTLQARLTLLRLLRDAGLRSEPNIAMHLDGAAQPAARAAPVASQAQPATEPAAAAERPTAARVQPCSCDALPISA